MPNLRPMSTDPLPVSSEVLMGAATPLDMKRRRKTGKSTGKSTLHSWQLKAYEYYDEINEIHYGANFIGNCLARVRLLGAEVPSVLSESPKETENKAIIEAVRNFTNERSGQTGLMRRFGQNMFLAGEVYIHGTEDEEGNQNWEIYSTVELSDNGNGSYTVRRASDEETEFLTPGDGIITRVWKEHPARAFDADSPIRTCSKQCEKLLAFDKADMAVARSRFAGSGILTIPAEIIPAAEIDDDGNIENDPAKHPFVKGLQDAMIEPIVGTESAEDVVPSLLIGQADYLKAVQHVTMDKEFIPNMEEKVIATIRRMATALDLPNEVLLGMEDTNHWTAWQIKEETFQTHIRPFVEMICNSLTVAYLHPILKKLNVKDYKKYIVWYDDTNLVARPDKSTAAKNAHDALVISDAVFARELGFTEQDAPDEEEYNRRAGLNMRDPLLFTTGEDYGGQIRAHDAKTGLSVDKSKPDANLPGPAKSAAPGTVQGEKESLRKTDIQASAGSTFSPYAYGYLEASIDRAIEKGGAKIRSLIPKTSEAFRLISSYSNEEVLGALDPATAEQYNINVENLLEFEQAVQFLKNSGIEDDYDFEEFKYGLKQEALRKARSPQKSNFSLNLDKLPK